MKISTGQKITIEATGDWIESAKWEIEAVGSNLKITLVSEGHEGFNVLTECGAGVGVATAWEYCKNWSNKIVKTKQIKVVPIEMIGES